MIPTSRQSTEQTTVLGSINRAFRPFSSCFEKSVGRFWQRDAESSLGIPWLCSCGGREPFSATNTILVPLREMLCSSWMNIFLVFVPVGLGTYVFDAHPILIFLSNALAVIPLSSLLTAATEMLASDAGDSTAALLNMSLGNLVEFILLYTLSPPSLITI